MMKTSLATNLHSLVCRTHTSSLLGTGLGMVTVSKSQSHRMSPVSLQAIIISTKQLRQFHSLSGLHPMCYEPTRVELQQLVLSRSYTSKSSPLSSIKQKPNPSAGSRSTSLTESSEESGAVTLSLGEKGMHL